MIKRWTGAISKSQKGFTFIEVLIALLVMSLVVVVFLISMATAGKALIISHKQTMADSLARSQMEFIKQQGYIEAASDGYVDYLKIKETGSYTIWSENPRGESEEATIVETIAAVPWDTATGTPSSQDKGIQRIKLYIFHGEELVLSLEGYKRE